MDIKYPMTEQQREIFIALRHEYHVRIGLGEPHDPPPGMDRRRHEKLMRRARDICDVRISALGAAMAREEAIKLGQQQP